LGPVEYTSDGGPHHHRGPHRPGGPRQQRLLAALLLAADRPVPTTRLTEAVWGEAPPATVAAQLYNAVSGLRRSLARHGGEPPRIEASCAGYTLRLGDHELDLVEFRELTARAAGARSRGDLPAAAAALHAAGRLWRGPALAGIADGVLGGEAHQLEEARMVAAESLVEIELALGRPQATLPELAALVAAHPLREGLVALQMRALYQSGRRAEALLSYAHLRRRLAIELGLDPEPGLVALHAQILRGAAPSTRTALAGRAS
jgi:DNA-binding SARP family transcriptional activator